eukprot:3586838-Lingulodinium_polyedra.AAC.1
MAELMSQSPRVVRLVPDYQRLRASADSLINLVGIMNRNALRMPNGEVEAMLDAWKRFISLTQRIEDLRTPKRHAVAHMIIKAPLLGNPRCYANWLDESLNRVLKAACRERSQATFEQELLLCMPALLPASRKRD